MYLIVEKDKFIQWDNARMIPVITLADEYGGRAQIVEDDHCYVLLLKKTKGPEYAAVTHWFKEAVEILKQLPPPE